jgi:hypothetical protein
LLFHLKATRLNLNIQKGAKNMNAPQKKNYEKPVAINLSERASGHRPLACLSGDSVVGYCTPGFDPASCFSGTDGNFYPGFDCYTGASPAANYGCLAGAVADFECSGGGAPGTIGTCTDGASNII